MGDGVTLKARNGVSTPRLERLMNGDLAAWITERTPIPGLTRIIKEAGDKTEHFRLALKNGDATTHILGWVRRSGDKLTLCVDGASVDKPASLREQLSDLWNRGVERKVSDPAFGRFVGVAIHAIRQRVTEDPTIKRVDIVGTQISSPHLAKMLAELGFSIDALNPTVPQVMSWGIAAGGLALTAATLASEPSLAGLATALAVVLTGGLAVYKTSSMRGSYSVDRFDPA
ncbi:MAG: hypothetical protein ACAI38_20360 [Myxococcota bacterium]